MFRLIFGAMSPLTSSSRGHANSWEASDALRKRLAQAGIELRGRPGGWAEMYRVFRECKFVEDEGDTVDLTVHLGH